MLEVEQKHVDELRNLQQRQVREHETLQRQQDDLQRQHEEAVRYQREVRIERLLQEERQSKVKQFMVSSRQLQRFLVGLCSLVGLT